MLSLAELLENPLFSQLATTAVSYSSLSVLRSCKDATPWLPRAWEFHRAGPTGSPAHTWTPRESCWEQTTEAKAGPGVHTYVPPAAQESGSNNTAVDCTPHPPDIPCRGLTGQTDQSLAQSVPRSL